MSALRWLLSAAILVLGGAAIWRFAMPPSGAGGVVLVDTRPALDDVLRRRAEDGASQQLAAPGELVRLPIDEELALKFHPALEDRHRNAYDPHAYYIPRPNFRDVRRFREHPAQEWPLTTDARGFRRPGEIAASRPDLRVLVVGDSHVEGVMPIEETLTLQLEGLLRAELGSDSVEVLNGSRGGYAFYNYLGALERNLDLQPHVFVMVVFGGNDFAGFLPMHLYFRGLELPGAGGAWLRDSQRAQREYGQGFSQEYHQIGYFARSPRALELALAGSVEVVLEAARICARNDIRFVCAYLPPMGGVERQRVREGLEKLEAVLELQPADVASTDHLADQLLARVGEQGVETLDLRPALRSSPGPLYYLNDHHLAPLGHQVVSRRLFERLMGRL